MFCYINIKIDLKSVVTGCFACEGFEEFHFGVEACCFDPCNGMWRVYMFNLSEADRH